MKTKRYANERERKGTLPMSESLLERRRTRRKLTAGALTEIGAVPLGCRLEAPPLVAALSPATCRRPGGGRSHVGQPRHRLSPCASAGST